VTAWEPLGTGGETDRQMLASIPLDDRAPAVVYRSRPLVAFLERLPGTLLVLGLYLVTFIVGYSWYALGLGASFLGDLSVQGLLSTDPLTQLVITFPLLVYGVVLLGAGWDQYRADAKPEYRFYDDQFDVYDSGFDAIQIRIHYGDFTSIERQDPLLD
jgi:hypothetical protein